MARPRGTLAQLGVRDDGYSIRVTSRLTSIALETLRIWERRYGFPTPARSASGNRIYSDGDVRSLRLITRALENGYRPGEVVGRSPDDLEALIARSVERAEPALYDGVTPASLVALLRSEDLAGLRSSLRRAAVELGPKRFVVEVAQPLCAQVGELWSQGALEIRHEHLLSTCLSAQLAVLSAAFEERPGSPRVVLATLPDERHSLGLEMVSVYLAASQVTSVLIGVDTPAEQIVAAARHHGASAVAVFVTAAADPRKTAAGLRWMSTRLPRGVRLWVGGAGAARARAAKADEVGSWAELDAATATLTHRRGRRMR